MYSVYTIAIDRGNCLFRAVSRQLYGTAAHHPLVRHLVVARLHKDGICTYVHMCVYIIHTYKCVCVYIYIYTCMYIPIPTYPDLAAAFQR